METDTRGRLSEVIAPCPPKALTAYELVTLRRLIEVAQRKTARKIAKRELSGRTASSTMTGEHSDEARLVALVSLDEEVMEAWLDATFGAVNESGVRGEILFPGTAAFDAAKEAWLQESRLPSLTLEPQEAVQ